MDVSDVKMTNQEAASPKAASLVHSGLVHYDKPYQFDLIYWIYIQKIELYLTESDNSLATTSTSNLNPTGSVIRSDSSQILVQIQFDWT